MPYIITINRPGHMPEAAPYAVATLNEAKDAARDEIAVWADSAAEYADNRPEHQAVVDAELASLTQVHRLSSDGGTAGPLPNGYVISVHPITRLELGDLTGLAGATIEQLVDAYNNT